MNAQHGGSAGTEFRRQVRLAFFLVSAVSVLAGGAVTYVAVIYLQVFGSRLVPPLTGGPGIMVDLARPVYHALGPGGFLIAVIAVAAFALLFTVLWLTGAASRRVLQPVGHVSQAAQRLAAGDLSVRLAVSGTDALADLLRNFNDMAASLEHNVHLLRAMQERARRFAADVAHELRTPLATMTAVGELLDSHADQLPPDLAKPIRLVSEETMNLTNLVEDLLEISRFDAGTANLVLDEVPIAALLAATTHRRNWGQDVHLDIPDGLTARVDPRRLDVILANLIGNALRHGAPPVDVHARMDPATTRLPRRLIITVRDHGPGLAPEAITRAFDRFWKADPARSRSDGSGLGLAIARENTLLHRGTLDVANHPDGGAVFTVTLPQDAG